MKKKNTVRCPYCGAEAKLRSATVVYGDATLNKNGYVYVCDRYPACDAYVAAHAESNCRWELWQTAICGISESAPIMRSISYVKAAA